MLDARWAMSVLPHRSPIGRTRSRRSGLGGTTGNADADAHHGCAADAAAARRGHHGAQRRRDAHAPHVHRLGADPAGRCSSWRARATACVRYYTRRAGLPGEGTAARCRCGMLAPVLVAATSAIFASGVALLALGHRSDLAARRSTRPASSCGASSSRCTSWPTCRACCVALRADWGVARRRAGAGRVAARRPRRRGAGRRRRARADAAALAAAGISRSRPLRSSGMADARSARRPRASASTSASPPCASAIARTIASPSPAPPWSRRAGGVQAAEAVEDAARGRSGTPGPSSSTTRPHAVVRAPRRSARTSAASARCGRSRCAAGCAAPG